MNRFDRRRQPTGKGKGHRTIECEGYEILVGKGAADNDRLTFDVGRPRDLWMHVAGGMPGSHVVIRNPDELPEIPRPVVRRAAELAAWYSKARHAGGKVEVHVCRVADVSKPPRLPAGKVVLRTWEALRVYPRGEDAADT